MEGKIVQFELGQVFVYAGMAWMIKEEVFEPSQVDLPRVSTYHFFHANPYGQQRGCNCGSSCCPLKDSWLFFRRTPDDFLYIAKEFIRLGIEVRSISTPPSAQAMDAFVEIVKTKRYRYFGPSVCYFGGGAEQQAQVHLYWKDGVAEREHK